MAWLALLVTATLASPVAAQTPLERATVLLTRYHDEETLFRRLDDLAEVDKVSFTGPPPRVVKNPTGQGAGNPVILSAYTFLPRKRGAAPGT